jgi:hypothetical protein
MRSNAYLGFSIAIFSINSSNAINAFVFWRKENIFCMGRFIEEDMGLITRRNTDIQLPNSYILVWRRHLTENCLLWLSRRFFGLLPCFLVYFSAGPVVRKMDKLLSGGRVAIQRINFIRSVNRVARDSAIQGIKMHYPLDIKFIRGPEVV